MSAAPVVARESEKITALGAVAGGCSKERISVTTCARCGQPVYPGAPACPTCGLALMGVQNGGPANQPPAFAPGQQQPNFGYPGAARNGNGNGNGSFSAGSLINSDALPDWLMQAGAGAPAAQPANGYGYGRGQAPAPGYGQAPQQPMYGQPPVSGGLGQPRQMAPNQFSGPLGPAPAQSLFDESALPDWLRQAASSYDVGQQPTAYQAAAPNPAYGGGPARYAAPPGPPGPPGPPQAPGYAPNGYNGYSPAPQRGGPSRGLGQPAYPNTQANAFPSLDMAGANAMGNGGGMSARGLVDSGALPGWLGGQSSQSPMSDGASIPGSGGLSARSLIDDSALPQWLRAQAAPAQAAPQRMHPPVPANPWSAPATADEPLPGWLNQAYMDANVQRIEPARAPSGWLSPGQGSGPLGGPAGHADGRLSASAFVEESALPEWLKSQGGVPAATTAQGMAASYAAPSPAAGQESRHFGAYVPGGASAPAEDARAEKFSVSDLIDPEALPSWVSGQGTSSGAGWASKQSSVLAAASSTSPRAASSTLEAARAPGQDTGGWDEPNLPAWMSSLGDEDNQPSRAHQGAPASRAPSDERMRDAPPGPGASSPRRRGQPIPSEELPPWLRSPQAGPAPRNGGYGNQQASQRQPASQQDWWPEEQDQSQQRWTDWDEDNFGAEYDGGMDFSQDGDTRQERQRGGWRRLFGRR